MEKAPFILVLFVATIGLLAANPGFRDNTEDDNREISSYDYSKLHAAIERDAEIAALARRELTQDHVTIRQYNKVMRKIDSMKLKQARQVATVRQASLR